MKRRWTDSENRKWEKKARKVIKKSDIRKGVKVLRKESEKKVR